MVFHILKLELLCSLVPCNSSVLVRLTKFLSLAFHIGLWRSWKPSESPFPPLKSSCTRAYTSLPTFLEGTTATPRDIRRARWEITWFRKRLQPWESPMVQLQIVRCSVSICLTAVSRCEAEVPLWLHWCLNSIPLHKCYSSSTKSSCLP